MDAHSTADYATIFIAANAKPSGWLSRAEVHQMLRDERVSPYSSHRIDQAFDAWHQRSEAREQGRVAALALVRQLTDALALFTVRSVPSECAYWTGDVGPDDRCGECDCCRALDLRVIADQALSQEDSSRG